MKATKAQGNFKILHYFSDSEQVFASSALNCHKIMLSVSKTNCVSLHRTGIYLP